MRMCVLSIISIKSSKSNDMYSFDIQDLLRFPTTLACCQKCLAITKTMKRNCQKEIHCPFCGVKYVTSKQGDFDSFRAYFREKGLYLQNSHIFEHCLELAAIAYRVNQCCSSYPPLAGLLQSLHLAKQFVHFTTFGISKDLLLVLKFISQQVQVRGVVTITPDQSWMLSEIKDYELEAPNLCIKTVCTSGKSWNNLPHQKLVVVDGLIAFKGSANLTTTAWRKAANLYDSVEVLTQVDAVITHHNRYFSSVWAKLSGHSDIININLNSLDNSFD